eukprot:Nitzschia sp. Nitz4//scaffold165_size50357//12241//14020//NITZ4_007016-RA/size50357-augustus-gene-0.21-mRNA-1//1//CDS//3329538117//8849//frame0
MSSGLEKQSDELLAKMDAARKKWAEEDEDPDDTDRLLQEAIALAVDQGKGWGPGEKEAYMAKILDDDFIPPIFAETAEEVERSGLAEAFSTLNYDDSPAVVMLEFKTKGTEAFMNGKRNEAKNVQYYRDAVNHYYEAIAWAQKIEPLEHRDPKAPTKPTAQEEPEYTEAQLDEMKSTLYGNAALAHLQLRNWGHVRDDCKKALLFNKNNVKALYRLAKAYQMLQCWEEAGDAIDNGLAVPGEAENKDLLKLQKQLQTKVRQARLARQQRERRRAERTAQVKQVWKHCKEEGYQLGRVALVASVGDDDEEEEDAVESQWHHHHPHTGLLPAAQNGSDWSWPCLFVYPSHSQSDFVKHMGEDEMLAMRMGEMYPEMEAGQETAMAWDFNNEFICSQLAVYFEVHVPDSGSSKDDVIHPDSVELLRDQGSTMKFYESSRALKGDEGPEMSALVQAVERKRLAIQRRKWKKVHGSLWAKPDPANVVRVHPACLLRDILQDKRMVAANFMVTLVVIPENHPAHEAYLKEHKCVGLLQPKGMDNP